METEKIVTACVAPATKLIDAVTAAIGKAYEPRYVRKMADARAYEIKMIGDEIRNNSDLPIVFDSKGSYSIDTSDYDSLVKRTGKRIAYQEVVKQENIETIVDQAYDSIKDIKTGGEGEISKEWMNRFINFAGDISTESMQELWSKVLAGEVVQPRSFSLRTLDCLRNMDTYDARLFETVCTLIIDNKFIINDDEFLNERGITYNSILELDESGLLNSLGTISSERSVGTKQKVIFDFGEYILLGKAKEKESKIFIQEYPLTRVGCEISKIASVKHDIEVIKQICARFTQTHKEIQFALHRVTSRNGDEIQFDISVIEL